MFPTSFSGIPHPHSTLDLNETNSCSTCTLTSFLNRSKRLTLPFCLRSRPVYSSAAPSMLINLNAPIITIPPVPVLDLQQAHVQPRSSLLVHLIPALHFPQQSVLRNSYLLLLLVNIYTLSGTITAPRRPIKACRTAYTAYLLIPFF